MKAEAARELERWGSLRAKRWRASRSSQAERVRKVRRVTRARRATPWAPGALRIWRMMPGALRKNLSAPLRVSVSKREAMT